MAKVKLNPMFASLDGKIGRIVHFSRYGRQYCRIHVVPANPRTDCQQAVRNIFAEAVRSWRELSPEAQGEYNRRARYMPLSGYNLYISRYMKANMAEAGKTAAFEGSHKGTSVYPSTIQEAYHTLTSPYPLRFCSCAGAEQLRYSRDSSS